MAWSPTQPVIVERELPTRRNYHSCSKIFLTAVAFALALVGYFGDWYGYAFTGQVNTVHVEKIDQFLVSTATQTDVVAQTWSQANQPALGALYALEGRLLIAAIIVLGILLLFTIVAAFRFCCANHRRGVYIASPVWTFIEMFLTLVAAALLGAVFINFLVHRADAYSSDNQSACQQTLPQCTSFMEDGTGPLYAWIAVLVSFCISIWLLGQEFSDLGLCSTKRDTYGLPN